ncbi:MAG: ABC transporter ATP-binding protein [Pirellulaceae bacterium]
MEQFKSPTVQFQNVTHHYGISPVLRDMSLDIFSGEVVAILGPNGNGKTTMLRLMAGVMLPFRGDVLIDGTRRRASEESELAIRSRVVYLPDDAWLPRIRTPREYVLAIAQVYSVDPLVAMERADRLFDLFDLNKQQNSPTDRLSQGQKKKVLLCGAFIVESPIMLMDEPFSGGLDPGGIFALKQLLIRRLGAKRTVVFSSPVPEIISEVADRILIVDEGRIAAFGNVSELCLRANAKNLEEAIATLSHRETLDRVERYFGESA